MAFESIYTDVSGVNYTAAYFRLTSFTVSLTDSVAEFRFWIYADREKRNANKQCVSGGAFSVTLCGDEFKKFHDEYVSGKSLGTIAYENAVIQGKIPNDAVAV